MTRNGAKVPASQYDVPRPVAEVIGQTIDDLLQARGWGPADLERHEGIAYNTVRRWISGDAAPSLGVLLHLVDVFELCSVEELLGGRSGTRACRVAAGVRHPHHIR